MAKLFANSGNPDQLPHSAASDLGLHCLPITFLQSPDYNGLKVNPKSVYPSKNVLIIYGHFSMY